jgi:hypothetical protein
VVDGKVFYFSPWHFHIRKQLSRVHPVLWVREVDHIAIKGFNINFKFANIFYYFSSGLNFILTFKALKLDCASDGVLFLERDFYGRFIAWVFFNQLDQ